MYFANGRQAKENCPDLKPLAASTFGNGIDLIGPNVTKPKRLLSAVCDSCPPDRRFPSWSIFTLNYTHPEWLKSSANGEEFIRVVPLFAALECTE